MMTTTRMGVHLGCGKDVDVNVDVNVDVVQGIQ